MGRLRSWPVRPKTVRVDAARDDVNVARRHAEGLGDVAGIRRRDGDDGSRREGPRQEVPGRPPVDVVAVRRERERHPQVPGQPPGCRRRFGREVCVEDLRLELSKAPREFLRIIERTLRQAGVLDERVAQGFRGRSQREDPHLDATAAQVSELARDEGLGDLWEHAEHVGHPAWRHRSTPVGLPSERASSTTRAALWSQVYRV